MLKPLGLSMANWHSSTVSRFSPASLNKSFVSAYRLFAISRALWGYMGIHKHGEPRPILQAVNFAIRNNLLYCQQILPFGTLSGDILFTDNRFCKPKVGSSILSTGTTSLADMAATTGAPIKPASRPRVTSRYGSPGFLGLTTTLSTSSRQITATCASI